MNWKLVLHWGLNVLAWMAAFTCFGVALFGRGQMELVDRLGMVLCGVVFSGFAFYFTFYTVRKG